MATGIPDKGRQVEACKKETLEDAVEYLLEEYDLKGANPYTMQGGKYTLVQLVSWLKKHKWLKDKSERRSKDILRNVLNKMMSIIRVGSTRKAMYAFDSEGRASLARANLDKVLDALLEEGGEANWSYLQELVKVDKLEGMTHLEFNSAVNYLVDNEVVEKKGKRAEREADEEGVPVIREDSRKVVCTTKAWGWEPGIVAHSEDTDSDLFTETGVALGSDEGWNTSDSLEIVIGGSTKKTHSIVLTERTSRVLEELDGMLNSLPDTDWMKPANINRSTIIEVALWTLYRNLNIKEGEDNEPKGDAAMEDRLEWLIANKDQLDWLIANIIEQVRES